VCVCHCPLLRRERRAGLLSQGQRCMCSGPTDFIWELDLDISARKLSTYKSLKMLRIG